MTAPTLDPRADPGVTVDVLALELLPEIEDAEDAGSAGCVLGRRAPARASAG